MDRCLNCGHELPSGTSNCGGPHCGVENLAIQASDNIAIGLPAEIVVEKRGQALDGIPFEIKAAIDRKAAKTAPAQRELLVLAIDALETPALLLDPVSRVFEGSYGESVRCLGFREIWLVGPTTTSTVRLAP